MTMKNSVKIMKNKLFLAIITLMISAVALASATYAWFAAQQKVKGTSSTISAMSNSFVLQIATLEEGAQHGDNKKSLTADTLGGEITPSSTDDIKNWYVCNEWGEHGKVKTYIKPADLTDKGKYTSLDGEHYAYLKSEYVLYTIDKTGICDVYLSPNEVDEAISVVQTDGETSDTIPKTIRVGITIEHYKEDGVTLAGDEELMVVYAPYDETGLGNDLDAKEGWTCVEDNTHIKNVTYPHIYGTNYTDQNGNKYAAEGSEAGFAAPENARAIATNVGYTGVVARVYIWLEGTDAECANNSESSATSIFSVIVRFAGVLTQ